MGNLKSEIFIVVKASSPSSLLTSAFNFNVLTTSCNQCGYLVTDMAFQDIFFSLIERKDQFPYSLQWTLNTGN